MSKWAIGLRLPGATDATVEHAFNEGSILRTHVLRPTWHFVTPADIRWMLALTAPRVRAAMAYMDRQLEVDRAVLKRSHAALVKALGGGNALTRTALREALGKAKIKADGPRLGHVLMHAELDGLICSGPRHGKQFTYTLLDERVPAVKPLARDAALAELTRRYFSSRGPATVQDFAWWSGLTIKDARAGVATLGHDFARDAVAGQNYVSPANPSVRHAKADTNFLLPIFDEYGIAYRDRSALFKSELEGGADHAVKVDVAFSRTLILDGKIAGRWRRTDAKAGIVIEGMIFAPVNQAKQRALTKAAQRYGAFLGKSVRVVNES